MTTIRDLLKDFGKEVMKVSQGSMSEEELNDLTEEYIETIKERMVG